MQPVHFRIRANHEHSKAFIIELLNLCLFSFQVGILTYQVTSKKEWRNIKPHVLYFFRQK